MSLSDARTPVQSQVHPASPVSSDVLPEGKQADPVKGSSGAAAGLQSWQHRYSSAQLPAVHPSTEQNPVVVPTGLMHFFAANALQAVSSVHGVPVPSGAMGSPQVGV